MSFATAYEIIVGTVLATIGLLSVIACIRKFADGRRRKSGRSIGEM